MFLWWCGGVFVVVFLWWCFCGGVFVVVFLRWCFCVGVVVFLWWCGDVFVVVFLWWCFCVGAVVFLCWCGDVFVVVFLSLCLCGGAFVVVFLWLCFCGGVFVLVFLCWCFCAGVFVVVFLWWCFCAGVFGVVSCGGVFVVVFLLLCLCGGAFVLVFLCWCFCAGVFAAVFLWWCFCAGVFVVWLRWCGGGGVLVVVFLWWCSCGGVQSTAPVLQNTTPYYKVQLRTPKYYSSTTPILLCTTKYYSSTTPYYRALLRPLKRCQNDVLPVLLRTTPVLQKLPKRAFRARLPQLFQEQASKTSISCDASSKFERTVLPKRAFRAMLPTIFTQNLRFATVSRDRHTDSCERVHLPRAKCASHYNAVHSQMSKCTFRYSGVRKNVWIYQPWTDPLRAHKNATFYYSFGRSTPRFYWEGCPTANEICVSLQFWAIDTTFFPRRFTARKWNLRFATVLGDRHHVFTERVARRQSKFAFRYSFPTQVERPHRTLQGTMSHRSPKWPHRTPVLCLMTLATGAKHMRKHLPTKTAHKCDVASQNCKSSLLCMADFWEYSVRRAEFFVLMCKIYATCKPRFYITT